MLLVVLLAYIMQFGVSTAVSIALPFIFIPTRSSSLISFWFCLDSQSVLHRSGPWLYIIVTLYW